MKPIYNPKGRAGEYCGWAVNIYTGCPHGCTYCYAAKMAKRWGRDFTIVEPRKGIIDALKKQLHQEKPRGRMIQLSFTCDPYPMGYDTDTTRRVIEAIKNSGNHVQILTKGGQAALSDFDLLDAGDWFGVTITGRDDLEPGAAPGAERYRILKTARERGISTWASFEPVFTPGLVYEYIEHSVAIDRFKIGKLNYAQSDIDWGQFGRTCESLCIENNCDYYIKDDLREEMKGGGGHND